MSRRSEARRPGAPDKQNVGALMGVIAENYRRIRAGIPQDVALIVAAKGRTPEEVAEVIEAGARMVGENYVQEAERIVSTLGEVARRVEWHMIGHLQRNKANRALGLFDVIQTVDSVKLARVLDARAREPVRVYVEVNAGEEESKSGVAPGDVKGLLEELSGLEKLRVGGLMAMEPYFEYPERARPCFVRMRELFEELGKLRVPNVEMKVLSIGMTNSYQVAIEEGANMVRVGTAIFGPRPG